MITFAAAVAVPVDEARAQLLRSGRMHLISQQHSDDLLYEIYEGDDGEDKGRHRQGASQDKTNRQSRGNDEGSQEAFTRSLNANRQRPMYSSFTVSVEKLAANRLPANPPFYWSHNNSCWLPDT